MEVFHTTLIILDTMGLWDTMGWFWLIATAIYAWLQHVHWNICGLDLKSDIPDIHNCSGARYYFWWKKSIIFQEWFPTFSNSSLKLCIITSKFELHSISSTHKFQPFIYIFPIRNKYLINCSWKFSLLLWKFLHSFPQD